MSATPPDLVLTALPGIPLIAAGDDLAAIIATSLRDAGLALAAGHVDLLIETELKPHDVAALVPIITGAGGVITTWTGEPAEQGGRIVAAGDRRVHEAALAMLGG